MGSNHKTTFGSNLAATSVARVPQSRKSSSVREALTPSLALSFSIGRKPEREKLLNRRERLFAGTAAARAHGWFAGMAEIRRRLNLTEREIREEIENLQLHWAFNFSASSSTVFTRVYEPALENWLNQKVPLPVTLDDLVKKLFPAARFTAGVVDTISGVEFQQVFNLSCPNMIHLLNARLILCRDEKWSNGITPRIFLPSVVEFLKRRRLP